MCRRFVGAKNLQPPCPLWSSLVMPALGELAPDSSSTEKNIGGLNSSHSKTWQVSLRKRKTHNQNFSNQPGSISYIFAVHLYDRFVPLWMCTGSVSEVHWKKIHSFIVPWNFKCTVLFWITLLSRPKEQNPKINTYVEILKWCVSLCSPPPPSKHQTRE